VPEGDTIFRAARTLHRALAGQVIKKFESVFPKLSRVDEDKAVSGRTVEKVEAQGKWLLMHLSGDLILLTHMLMKGSWHIYRPGEKWKLPRHCMRVVIETQAFVAVAFNLQIAEFHSADSLQQRKGFATLGPALLAEEFDDGAAKQRLLQNSAMEVGEVLLRQSVLAGIGNVYKSEVCFACGVHPFRKITTLTDAEAASIIAIARKYLLANVTDNLGDGIVTYTGFRRTTRRANPEERLWVYHRGGKPCRRCGTLIESRKQGLDARTTFWCPECQRMATRS
jgi:endonuclease VIII